MTSLKGIVSETAYNLDLWRPRDRVDTRRVDAVRLRHQHPKRDERDIPRLRAGPALVFMPFRPILR